VVLPKVKRSVATERGEEVSILWNMADTPDSRLVSHLCEPSVTLLRMVSLHVEHVEFRLESGDYEFVHVDIRPVKLDSANSVRHVCVPSQTISSEVEQLYITVVISCHQTSLFLVECITESHCPAVRLDSLTFTRFQTYYRRFLSWVPDAYAAVRASCNKFRRTILCPFTPDSVNLVTHGRVCLDLVLGDSSFDIVDDQFAFIVNCGTVTDAHRRGLKSAAFYSELLFPLRYQL